MIDHKNLIVGINKTCGDLFEESSFYLHQVATNSYKISGDFTSQAINFRGEERDEVTVIKWFEDFWLYSEINFINTNCFISLSVFQGKDSVESKHQLFRAEWDDYNDNQNRHPQPHWHITANKALENTLQIFTDYKEVEGFMSILNEEKSKIINVNDIHFAMIGNWINSETHIHKLDEETKIVKWFFGLLSHIKTELESIK
ncbi:MAG: hypothetical protein QM541_15000 [Flavobacterium sp.]|nr:hypothetical protein [Flavobacterium sp.]